MFRADLLRFAFSLLLYMVVVKSRCANADRKLPPKKHKIIPVPARMRNPTPCGGAETAGEEFRASIHEGQLHAAIRSLLRMDNPQIVSWRQLLDLATRHQDLTSLRTAMRQHLETNNVVAMYSNAIHASLHRKRVDDACTFLDDMMDAGVVPTVGTFNAVLIQVVDCGVRKRKAWRICDDMMRFGVAPNHVTGSSMLKMLGTEASEADIKRSMDFIYSIGNFAHEGLASSALDCLTRAGATSAVSDVLQKLRSNEAFKPTLPTTFTAILKAYHFVSDIQGLRQCWENLRADGCRINGVTVGCMVEALVCEGEVDGAYKLICELRASDDVDSLFTAVVFGSILKGYGRQHRMAEVWDVFQEMVSYNIKPEISTMNTMIDACVRNKEMRRLPELLEIMRHYDLSPDLITYSIMIKGHCQCGNVHLAIAIFRQMKQSTVMRCDRVIYGTLLDGCLTANLTDESEFILQEMTHHGFELPAVTLVRMVRMYGRARQIGKAFDLVAKLTSTPPASVLVALINVSIAGKDVPRAMIAFEQTRRQALIIDVKTQQSIVFAAISHGMLGVVEGVIFELLGLGDPNGCSGMDARETATFVGRLLRVLRADDHFEYAKYLEAELHAKSLRSSRRSWAG